MSEKEELEKLKKTFEEFITTSSQLQNSYQVLKAESQQLSLYLSNILDNMDAAIMVFDNDMSLTLWNGETRRYFPILENRTPPLPLDELSNRSPINLKDILTGQKKMYELETESNGIWNWLEINSTDFLNTAKEKIGYLVVINDKTQLKKLQLKSQQEDRLRVMGELAAEVAHEIRNPLGSIELMVTLLQDDLKSNESHKDILSRIRTSVNNMNHTVTNILLYTKDIQLDRQEFSLEELVNQAEDIAMKTIVKKHVSILKQVADVAINADFELLKQCLANILINAAQAVDMNGKIEVSALRHNNGVTLKIKDDGHGIPDTMKDKIFKPFFTTKNTGTGLGLAMVKRVIEAHSGGISFESTEKGTEFNIEFSL